MSVQYLLDGYNAIHQISQMIGQRTIRQARESLLRYLRDGDFCGSSKNQMTVIFDGQPGIWYPKQASAIKVIFSSNETADDLIKRIVAQAISKKNIFVITDDKSLKQSVRALGAKTLSIADFFGRMDRGSRIVSRRKEINNEKDISKVVEFKINDELKRIWINERE